MQISPFTLRLLAVFMLSLSLVACGGGGGSNPPGNGGNSPPGNDPSDNDPPDTVPDGFTVAALENAVPDADYVLSTTLKGLDPDAAPSAEISGEECSAATVALGEPNDTGDRELSITLRTPNAFETTLTCTVDVEGVTADVTVTTGNNAFAHEVTPGALTLSWAGFEQVHHYALTRFNAATGEEEIVADDIPGDTAEYSLPIHAHLVDWINDRFTLSACTTHPECDTPRSIPQHEIASLGQALSVQAMHYAKPSTPDQDDTFGHAVAVNNDLIAVGIPGDDSNTGGEADDCAEPGSSNCLPNSGAVVVFARENGEWRQDAWLKAVEPTVGSRFGHAVALQDDTLVVGTDNSFSNDRAYVFRRTDVGWFQEALLRASNAEPGDRFGFSVALHGNRIAIGATDEDSNATGVNGDRNNDDARNSGAVYVFERNGTQWTQTAYIKASNTGANDFFGTSVALFDNTLIVGATGEDSAATGVDGEQGNDDASASGAVYVFEYADDSWAQQAYVKASDPAAEDLFGERLALHGDRFAVAATGKDAGEVPDSGAAYLFERDGLSWRQAARLQAPHAAEALRFGDALALDETRLAIGTQYDDSAASGAGGESLADCDADTPLNCAADSGAVHLFEPEGDDWQHRGYLKASNTGADDRFGSAVAISGDTLIVGAPDEDGASSGMDGDQDDDSLSNSGAVYIF